MWLSWYIHDRQKGNVQQEKVRQIVEDGYPVVMFLVLLFRGDY